MNLEKTFQINITGIVQGVGFRPFIFNLAIKKSLTGDVCNTSNGVIIRINALDREMINDLIVCIKKNKPDPAYIETVDVKEINYLGFHDFKIAESKSLDGDFSLISPDLATCSDCLIDINNRK